MITWPKWRGQHLLLVLLTGMVMGACAPAQLVMNPSLPPEARPDLPEPAPVVRGSINYHGNMEYLPRTVAGVSGGVASTLEISYAYKVTYGPEAKAELVALFNPLTLVGLPTSSSDMVVIGSLSMHRGEQHREYHSSCTATATRNLFDNGETLSELRRRCLLANKAYLERQMMTDTDLPAWLAGN